MISSNMQPYNKFVLYALLFSYVGFLKIKCDDHVQSFRPEEDPIIETPKEVQKSKYSSDESLMLVSTLEGNLIAINKRTGVVQWKLEDKPVIKHSKELSKTFTLLPDPKDGSLYMLGSTRAEALTKLPFTIPELVAASPSQSSDGMLYMGKKIDMWFMIDSVTGERQETLSFEELERACPRNQLSKSSIFIGRTEYSLVLLDSTTRERHWNVTYFDYTSSVGAHDLKDYDLAHFTTSSTGKILTLDRHSGDLLWQNDLNSPIVGIYGLMHDISEPNVAKGIISIPFTSLSSDTLQNLAARLKGSEEERRISGDTKLFQALYIGQYQHGLYAFPSLVDELTTLVAPHSSPLLLEGPDKASSDATASKKETSAANSPVLNLHISTEIVIDRTDSRASINNPPLTFIGHYKVPEIPRKTSPIELSEKKTSIEKALDALSDPQKLCNETLNDNPSDGFSRGFGLVYAISMLAISLVSFYILYKAWRGNTARESLDPSGSQSSYKDRSNSGANICSPVELKNGWVQTGKIIFNPTEILGKGCDGTFVYKGKYDCRDVAVKRLLPECFTVADREVALLRESDAHPNVIRYFCTEQDRQFKYIALELCVATLQDYIEGRYVAATIDGITILRHATAGLAHLHSLDIVHRDIKPQNVLISTPNTKGEIRAMISDFGLCKKLKIGRMSFSRRSGVAGTEGWIAPEMMTEETVRRTTCAVDIFSLGLVYFYVLSKGQHPFGDTLRRQANILSGDYDLTTILSNVPGHTLIEKMLSVDSLERPPARAILRHPLFWPKEKILAFFQDVSDRVEKESSDSVVLQRLERAAHDVVRGSWRTHLEDIVMEDLRRHRTYQGRSVRDLLRALRNKKNHYREVADEVRNIMGKTPEEFCDYWISRFPKLLMHSWYAMHCVKNEHIFSRYYDKQYDFIQKYIVWPTPKAKTDFHRALETAFPVYDPLFPKANIKLASRTNVEETENEKVPESWDERLSEETESNQAISKLQLNSSPLSDSTGSEENKELPREGNSNLVVATNNEPSKDVDIVLGPGGQWGFQPARPPLLDQSTNGISVTPRVAAWSLPTAQQQWEFSEITHHGRKKQRANNRKKKFENQTML